VRLAPAGSRWPTNCHHSRVTSPRIHGRQGSESASPGLRRRTGSTSVTRLSPLTPDPPPGYQASTIPAISYLSPDSIT
jgi:hypothetical protein